MCIIDTQPFDSKSVGGDALTCFGAKSEKGQSQMSAIAFLLQKMLKVFQNGLALL